MMGVLFCIRRIAMMVVRLEVDGEDFESGNEIFEGEKIRGDAEYRYYGLRRGLGLNWTMDWAVDDGREDKEVGW
jgi:hypothetical protein